MKPLQQCLLCICIVLVYFNWLICLSFVMEWENTQFRFADGEIEVWRLTVHGTPLLAIPQLVLVPPLFLPGLFLLCSQSWLRRCSDLPEVRVTGL